MAKTTFRRLGEKDARQVFLFGRKYFASPKEYSWDWSEERVRQYATGSFATGIVALDGRKIVGFSLAENSYSSQRPGVGWLTYILVHPSRRHHSLGRVLLGKTLDEMKKSGVSEVITDVYTKNMESIRFFSGNGFRVKERWVIMARKT